MQNENQIIINPPTIYIFRKCHNSDLKKGGERETRGVFFLFEGIEQHTWLSLSLCVFRLRVSCSHKSTGK